MILSRADVLTLHLVVEGLSYSPSCGRRFYDFIWDDLFTIFNLLLKVFQNFITFW